MILGYIYNNSICIVLLILGIICDVVSVISNFIIALTFRIVRSIQIVFDYNFDWFSFSLTLASVFLRNLIKNQY